MYENFVKNIYDIRTELADAVLKIIGELFPKTKCRKIYRNGKIYIMVNKNTILMLIGNEHHQFFKGYGEPEIGIDVSILPEHTIHEFLFAVFEKYEDGSRIIVKKDDMLGIISELTEENYKDFLIKKDADKFNI